MAGPKPPTDVSTFDDAGMLRTTTDAREAIPTQLVAKIAGPVSVEAGELKITVGPLTVPGSDKPSIQGDVCIEVDGKRLENVRRIVLIGDAKTGWSAELTLYPLITRPKG